MNIRPPKRIRNHVNPLADRTVIDFSGFDNHKSIIVDIGAYRGEFSQQLVENFSNSHNFIVTEIRKPYAEYLRKLFTPHKNVAVFDGDSAKNIAGLIEQSVKKGVLIDYIFINFPDPWFKEKHKKRRVLNVDFLTELINLPVSNDTKIIFQTDQKNLFDETTELIKQTGKWGVEYFNESLWGIQSYWETMKIKEAGHIYRMKITKID